MKRQFGPRIEIKTLDNAAGTFSGYGAVFGNEDENGDIIERGAFAATLKAATETKQRNRAKFLLPLLKMHDESEPVGGIVSAIEDSHGLLITAACDVDIEAGRAVFSGIRMGYMSALSIGYNTVRSTTDMKGVRHLQEIKLWEISAVTTGYAANADARVDPASVKSKGTTMNKREKTEFNQRYGNLRLPASRTGPPIPDAPDRAEFKKREDYDAAMVRWHDLFRPPLPEGMPIPSDFRDGIKNPEYQRALDDWGVTAYKTRGLSGSSQTAANLDRKAAFRDAQDSMLAERCRSGQASVGEMLAYHRATGWTPSGLPLPDAHEADYTLFTELEESRHGR